MDEEEAERLRDERTVLMWKWGYGHYITVAKFRELLGQLRDDDVLTPNRVDNLAVLRGGTRAEDGVLSGATYIGFVDLRNCNPHVELDVEGKLEVPALR